MYCKKCGNKIEDGLAFCTACGAKAEAENSTYNVNYYTNKPYSSNIDGLLTSFPEKINKAKSLTTAALVMSVISFILSIAEIVTGIILPAAIMGYSMSFNAVLEELAYETDMSFPVSISKITFIACIIIFVAGLIFHAFSIFVFYKKNKKMIAIFNKIKYKYDQKALEDFLNGFKTGSVKAACVLNVINCVTLLSIPLCIAQILASFALINIKKDYDGVIEMYGIKSVKGN